MKFKMMELAQLNAMYVTLRQLPFMLSARRTIMRNFEKIEKELKFGYEEEARITTECKDDMEATLNKKQELYSMEIDLEIEKLPLSIEQQESLIISLEQEGLLRKIFDFAS